MTWLQRLYVLAQYKPMAVPVMKNDPFQHDLSSVDGYNAVDRVMTEETAQKESEKYPDLSYLGEGAIGLATQLENGHVVKYTTEKEESLAARYVMQKQPPCCAKVYKVENIQQHLWSIELEKVRQLSSMERIVGKLISDFLHDRLSYISTMNTIHKNPDQKMLETIEKCKNKINRDFNDLINSVPHDSYYIVTDYIEMWNCLIKNGISTDDAHAFNIGYNSNNELVLFDFGYSYVQEDKRENLQLNQFDPSQFRKTQ